MSKKNGYSLCVKDDGLFAASVSALEPGRWRVDHLDQGPDEAGSASPSTMALGKSPERLTMMVPGAEVRTSLISLPKLKKKELNLAVSGWVAREESSAMDEWSISWRERQGNTGEDKKETKDIFLLYASREDVDKQMASASSWGSTPTSMLPDYMILDAMFRRFHPEGGNCEAWNIVFVGEDAHFLCVSTQGSMLLTRPLPVDLSEGADDKEYMDRLATEVDRSIFFARQTEFNPDIERIIVCGDSDLARGLIEQLKDATTIPAEYWDVAESFQYDGGSLDSRTILPLMAAALDQQKVPFNLLPEKSRILLGPVARRRLILAASTAAVAAVPILMAGGFLTARIQDRYLDRARLSLEQASVRADAAAEIYKAEKVLSAREEHIADFTLGNQDYAGILLHLASLTPKEILFKDLRLKEAGDGRLVLFLGGESNSDKVAVAQQSFLTFLQALNSSNRLVAAGEPRKLVISTKTDKGTTVKKVEFSMEYKVRIGASDQVDEVTVAVLEEGDFHGRKN